MHALSYLPPFYIQCLTVSAIELHSVPSMHTYLYVRMFVQYGEAAARAAGVTQSL